MRKHLFISLLSMAFVCGAFAQNTVYMMNGKVRMCKGSFFDSDNGDPKGYYAHNENFTLTLSVPGAKNITLKFKSFKTEDKTDWMRIFDGKDTFSPLIGKYSGIKGPGTVTSSDSFITIHFTSDKSVAWDGWEADIIVTIIPPVAPKFTMAATVKCDDMSFLVNSDKPVHCDSLLAKNAIFLGPITPSVTSITPMNCVNKYCTQFRVNLASKLDINGSYSFELVTFFKDFCDSIYKLTSKVNFQVLTCPLKVVLTADNVIVCKGSCTFLRAVVSGGNPSKYIYSWTPSGLSGAGPIKICPTVNTQYILKVTDGISIPSSDTVDITVLDPPVAQQDTDVCYTSGNFFLRATPAGGKWGGQGIVNATTGEFKPVGLWGYAKVWYQIGSCADTVLVLVTAPWNLENVFCQNTGPAPLWWYWPPGGTWTGPRVTGNGIFNPDTAKGTYTVTYTWKGCASTKKVTVDAIKVPRYDTTCESSTWDTLKYSPLGIYPNWFQGMQNQYWGWYMPSQMGGPGTRTIIWNASGCKDTTYLTVMPSYAGPTDTFCPAAGPQVLKNFRPASGYTWTGRGIVDPTKADYDPSFFYNYSFAKMRDTLTISAGGCKSVKYVDLIPTRIVKKDTLFFCYEDTGMYLDKAIPGISPARGIWTGPGVNAKNKFVPAVAGYGAHTLIYAKNGCQDTIQAFVRPKPIAQGDTTICISSAPFACYAKVPGGSFWGTGITNNLTGMFSPSVAGSGVKNLGHRSKEGCWALFKITVDPLPAVNFTVAQDVYCFRDTLILLTANLPGGVFSGPGVTGNTFNPNKAGTGAHSLLYTYNQGTCVSTAKFDVTVGDTLKAFIAPQLDSVCPGTTVWLKGSGTGGDKFSYAYTWSTGMTGPGIFVTPKSSATFSVTLNDGCSDAASSISRIVIHPRPWFAAATSAPKCFGQKGWVKVWMQDGDPYRYSWDMNPPMTSDSIYVPVGGAYRVTATNLRTGCASDTVITVPGFKALNASFIKNISSGEACITNISPTLRIFNSSDGGTTGTWYWGDGSSEPYDPNVNPKHTYDGELLKYKIKLVIMNEGGCIDSTESWICFRDTIVVYIPTIFTPNSDGKNDVFFISAAGVRDYELMIYNTYGEIVYRSNDLNASWDGNYRGRPVANGVYPYRIAYSGKRQGTRQLSGVILVGR